MKSDAWMAFYVGDYVANTMHLTTRQHGAYILLICAAWKAGGILPGTDVALASIGKLSPREWREDGETLKRFLTRRDDDWIHERVMFEWNEAQGRTADKSKAGKAGARARWHGRANGKVMAAPLATPPDPHRQLDAQSQSPLGAPPKGRPPNEDNQTPPPIAAREQPLGAAHDSHKTNQVLENFAGKLRAS